VGDVDRLRLIGLTGYSQHGKDSVGAFLVERFGYTRFAFADQLKEMVYRLNPIIENDVRLQEMVTEQGWDQAKTHPEVRRTLQVLGTECVRDILGVEAWIDALSRKLGAAGVLNDDAQGFWPGPTTAVITDVRFPNEAAAIHRWGGQVWMIVRVNHDGTSFNNGIGMDHPSEKHIASIVPDEILRAMNLDRLFIQVRARMQ